MYRKLQVFVKTTNFRQATKLVNCTLVDPNEEQIRVRNIYAGINATDINITAARYLTDGKVPYDIGLESIGIVDAIGKNVTNFTKNQPVLLLKKRPDCFSEYIFANKDELLLLPDLKPNYLVSHVNGLTASISLDHAGRIKSGEKVLITSAAGGTGQIAVQWAKHRGAYVIAMTSSEEKADYLKKLGADFIINYKKDNIDTVLREHFPNGIDIVWETIGGETFQKLFRHLSIKGRLIIIGSISSYKEPMIKSEVIDHLQLKLMMESKSLTGFMVTNYTEHFREYLPKLIGKIHSGEFQTRIDMGEQTSGGKFFGLEQVFRAEEYLHSGKNTGKVVVQIQEP